MLTKLRASRHRDLLETSPEHDKPSMAFVGMGLVALVECASAILTLIAAN